MSRNTKRNTYVTLGLAKSDTLLDHLQAEAARLELDLPTYVKQLLKDRDNALYEDGPLKGYWFPRGFIMPSAPSERGKEAASMETTEATILANAQGALSAWANDDE